MPGNNSEHAQRAVLAILNDLFLLERKIAKAAPKESLMRYVSRIKEHFVLLGFTVDDPLGEPFSETRTDCDATIAGESTENLIIEEVLKPIVRHREQDSTFLLQRAVVIVRSNS